MKIKHFKIIWYCNIFEQVIIWWSKLKIDVLIDDYDWTELVLDISNYSHKKFISFFCNNFSKIIEVNFLWYKGLSCGKKSLDSRIKLKNKWNIYYSNTIWNYIFNEDFVCINNYNFKNLDHHLWVYNKYENSLYEQVRGINKIKLYPNDIIFFDRNKWNLNNFINLWLNFNYIIKSYIINLKRWKKSIFYRNIFWKDSSDIVYENINRILKSFKYGTYFIYNVDLEYLDNYVFDEKYYLYDYHFKPVFSNFI